MHELLNFNDKNLLHRALTHSTFSNEYPDSPDNQRLEFLGDRILGLISGDYIYQCYTDMEEGEMTLRQSALVNNKQLAQFAIKLGLDKKMLLGKGEEDMNGRSNQNNLGDCFEAVVGAYYLDKKRNIELIRPLIEELFKSVPKEVFDSHSRISPIGELQQYIQSKDVKGDLDYREIPDKSESGFHYQVYINEKLYGEGTGRKKQDANLEKSGLLTR
jgi:ribonuclease-3